MNIELRSAKIISVETEEKANEILKNIKAGNISFEDAVREYSIYDNKDRDGSLGNFPRGFMWPEVEEVLFNMEIGEVSEVIKNEQGFNIIKREEACNEAVHSKHILVETEQKANEILNDIKSGKISFEDAARENSLCPSKDNGGDLGIVGRDTFVKEFDEAVFSMNEGEISEPVKTQFGYHIIRLESRYE